MFSTGYLHSEPEPYDPFFCLTKRCKARKDENRRLRNARKGLKNDQRAAEVERTRTETELLRQAGVTAPAGPYLPPPLQSLQVPTPAATPREPGTPTWVFILLGLGVLGLGGFIIYKRRQAALAPTN